MGYERKKILPHRYLECPVARCPVANCRAITRVYQKRWTGVVRKGCKERIFMPTILIICSGNTCRSPVVEALLKAELAKYNRPDWTVHSAGTRAQNGQPATEYSVVLCQEQFGLDLARHRSKKVTRIMLDSADLVLCMTADHQNELSKLVGKNLPTMWRLAEIISEDGFDVPDPFGQNKQTYRRMVKTVSNIIDEGLPKIIALAQA